MISFTTANNEEASMTSFSGTALEGLLNMNELIPIANRSSYATRAEAVDDSLGGKRGGGE